LKHRILAKILGLIVKAAFYKVNSFAAVYSATKENFLEVIPYRSMGLGESILQ